MRYLKELRLFGAALLSGGFIGLLLKFPPTDSGSAASWVQAVGSVLAIIATAILFMAQQRADRRSVADAALLNKRISISKVEAIAWWSVEAMRDAIASRRGGPRWTGLPFRPERFDQLRSMMERVVEATDVHAVSLIALAVCNRLNEAHNAYVGYVENRFSVSVDALKKCEHDTQEMLDRIVDYHQKVVNECRNRGLEFDQTEVE